jgi:hypothetical protein
MTPFAYATPHSNAPYIERPRSGSDGIEVSIYEDEDVDDVPEHQGGGSTTDEVRSEDDETGYEERALSDFDPYEEDGTGESVELGMGQHEEWKGVQDLGVEDDVEEDEDGSESTPSEYPSTQPMRQIEPPLFSGTKVGFRIHVDEDEGDEL